MSSAAFYGRRNEPPYLSPGEAFIKDASDDYLIEELQSRGYECLKRHDGVPVDEGEYLVWLRSSRDGEPYCDLVPKEQIGFVIRDDRYLFALGPLSNYLESPNSSPHIKETP